MFGQTTISEVNFLLVILVESCVITSLERVCVEIEGKASQLTVTNGEAKVFRECQKIREKELSGHMLIYRHFTK